jgi:hypothetical protein
MKIGWITFGAPFRRADGQITSNIASLRYRVLSPITAMSDAGHEHRITPMNAEVFAARRETALAADILVFSKSFLSANESLARDAQTRGATVVFDICDNHFDHPQHGDHYRRMAELADHVVCNTPQMAQIAGAHSRQAPTVIADPYEGFRGRPAFAPPERLRLLWFGHPSNLDSLYLALADLMAFARRHLLSLTVLTEVTPQLADACARIGASDHGALSMCPEAWSLEAQWAALAACDAVIIPSRQTGAKQVKSANRMVEALWAGRPVVAEPLPAYLPFSDWTPVRPSLAEGLDALLSEASDTPRRLADAQRHIAEGFSPAVTGRQWRILLEAARSGMLR